MFFSVLGLGFVIGMQHAFEADHVAAVSTIASRRTGIRSISRHGLFWGLGHTLTLFAVAGSALLLKVTINDQLSSFLEMAVGMMLVALGLHLLYRLARDRVHFHIHDHSDGATHFHAHSHKGETSPHDKSSHDHQHHPSIPWRTFGIGLMHGLAGSAALVVLASTTFDTPLVGLFYVLLFGIGSIIGMILLSAVIAVPITYSARYMTITNGALQLVIGAFTLMIGLHVIYENLSVMSKLS